MKRPQTDGEGTAIATGTCPDCGAEVLPVPT